MNPSLPPQISSERSPQRWSAERSMTASRPSCSFEIKRPPSRPVMERGVDRSAIALPQGSSPPPQSPINPTFSENPDLVIPPQRTEIPPHSPSFQTPPPAKPSSPPEDFSVVPLRSLPVPAQPSAVTAAQVVPPVSRPVTPHPVASYSNASYTNASYSNAHKATITVQPFAVQQDIFKEPSLPRLKQVQLKSHRHSSNPVFPLSLLQDIATIVEDWQAQLEGLHEQVQAIYLDGPIVDGWLEAEATLDGVIQGYRLCGLDDQGQMWVRPCPPDQLPSVSTAIARYQHLRQVLAQKQALEVRFQQLGETLAMVRSSL
ncbi:MAG: hypothetical protein ACO3EZ_09105 [Prochlorotrichaceae cyanobacterium]